LVFWEYDATNIGDTLGITTTVLGTANQGTYQITDIVDKYTVIVSKVLTAIGPVTLNAGASGLYVQELIPYTGYKVVYNNAVDPANPAQSDLIFDTRFQADYITTTANVVATALNKLDFITTTVNGLDAYRYDTGLLAEVNRIIYGDPRDNVTYPGVVAAGADVFTDPPFFRRVQVAVAVRLITGAPFTQITEQVQDAVQALIDSNPIGQSIPIGNIVAAVESIPGVYSAAISSPLYNAANDLITLQPSEKSKIINPSTDISVLQIGS
jgi:hypothetical protein